MTAKGTILLVFVAEVLFLPPLELFAQEKPDALAMYRNGQFQQAVQICLNELQQTPRNLDSFSVLGWSLLKLGRYQDAVTYALQALAISRSDVRIIEILGEGYFFLGDNDDSLKYLQQYTAMNPDGDRIDTVYDLMGEIFLRLGEYNRADIALTTAVYYSPNVAQWWARLGYAREMAKSYPGALEAYNRALALNPALADAVRGKARVAAIGQ